MPSFPFGLFPTPQGPARARAWGLGEEGRGTTLGPPRTPGRRGQTFSKVPTLPGAGAETGHSPDGEEGLSSEGLLGASRARTRRVAAVARV